MLNKKWYGLLALILSLCLGTLQADITDGLVSYWPLSDGEGTEAMDIAGQNPGTLMGDATWTEGKIGGAVYLDGDGDYIIIAADPSFNLNQLTIAAWVKPEARPGYGWSGIMMRGNSSGEADTFALYYHHDGRFGFKCSGTSSAWNSFDAPGLYDGEWHHAAATYDGAIKVSYLDGAVILSAASTGDVLANDDGNLYIGAGRDEESPTHLAQGSFDDARLYSRALSVDEINQLQLAQDPIAGLATSPSPGDQAVDVPIQSILSWKAGELAVSHNVYFGTSVEDVLNATANDPRGVRIGQEISDPTLDPGALEFGQTYYWRVDEVNSPANPGIIPGGVWTFTVESIASPVTPIAATASSSFMPTMGPEKTIDGSGINEMDQHSTSGNDMWLTGPTDTERWIQYEFAKPQKLHQMLVWNSNQTVESFIGFGSKSVTIETSLDGSDWTALADAPEFAQASGLSDYVHNTIVDFGGLTAQFVKMTVNAGWGSFTTQSGISEVRFLAIPVYASQPQPADGAMVDVVDATLGWRAGREAVTHEVVLSSDRAAVEAGIAIAGTPSTNSLGVSLNYGTEYFWAVNEINDGAETPRYEGDIWSFTAPMYLVIDNFEMYADREFLEIWAFWADGYENDNNGAIVGDGNIGERDIVYEGRQSMPIHYDNSAAAVSEVTRTFSPLLDMNTGAPTTLSLQVRGDAAAFIDGGDTLTVGASGGDIWNAADEFRFVYKTLNGNGSITAKVESLTHVHDWAKAGVMIRETLTQESSCVYTVATGASGVTFQYRTTAFTNAASDSSTRDASWAAQDEPVWVKVERVGDEFNGYISLDGVNWTGSVSNPQTIVMLAEVKIGFCVTSHDNDQSSTAVFSNVSTTGGVSGNWAVETFGEGHPDNDAAPMYLVLTDGDGREKIFSHPDADATLSTSWAPWQMALGDVGSVNLGSIEKITIGIGEPGGSASGAQGTVYVDLLQAGTPLP